MSRYIYTGPTKQVRLPNGRTVLGRYGMSITSDVAPEGPWLLIHEGNVAPPVVAKQQSQEENRMMGGPEETKDPDDTEDFSGVYRAKKKKKGGKDLVQD